MALLPSDRILGPPEAYGVVSAAAYLAWQLRIIAGGRASYPALQWRDPWTYEGPAPQFLVSWSRLQIFCACGNCPAYSVEWQLACCPDCGAIYRVPPPAGWAAIAAVLLQRPRLSQRNWLPGETLETLCAENVAHGDPVPVEVR